ncbi:hypothetical protein KJ664_02495, partial [Patescibacteria group bacterium]|nr:hypothetical protein [Patescibacteria group bacterium]
MLFSIFLHIYQPEDQYPDVLDRIVNESYRPIFKFLVKNPSCHLTFNINAVLTELWDRYHYTDLIDNVKTLIDRDQIELTESAKYHAFLPLIPHSEVVRQIELNHETNKFYFGKNYHPAGFFSPEMSYSPKIVQVIGEMGYKYILADEIAYNGKLDQCKFNAIYKIKGTEVNVYFRHKNLSNIIMGANIRPTAELVPVIKKYSSELSSLSYLLVAMDGETFGHHRIGLEKLLFGLLQAKELNNVTISQIAKHIKKTQEVTPVDSTWASSEKDLANGTPFNLWYEKENRIHQLQWELTGLAISTVSNNANSTNSSNSESRKLLDSALHSCHYWWASAKPWWSLEMIELGAYKLWQVVEQSLTAKPEEKEKAFKLYQDIIATAFSWQRTGYVRKLAGDEKQQIKVPFKDRGKPGEYKALLELLEKQEKLCAQKGEYEQAIRWRDGRYKLKNNLDIYDAVHVIDQLRQEEVFKDYDNLVQRYSHYKTLSPGQPEK